MQELPTEEKEGYLTRAILLMNNQPMVSIMMVMDVFLLRLLISGGGGGCQQRQAVIGPWSPRPRNQSTLTKSFDLSPFVLCQFQDLNNCPTETASVICIVNLILFVVLFLRLPIVRICEIHCCDFGAPANFFAGSSFLMDICRYWMEKFVCRINFHWIHANHCQCESC